MDKLKIIWKKCGTWGVRKRTMPAKGQNFDGFTAPLWRNPSRKCILFTTIFSGILFVALLITFLAVFAETVCDTDFRSLMIVQIIFLFVDGIYQFILYHKKYASDQEWSRYMVYMLLTTVTMVLLGTISIILALGESDTVTEDCQDGARASPLWKASIATSILIFLYSLNKVGLLISLALVFYRGKGELAKRSAKSSNVQTK